MGKDYFKNDLIVTGNVDIGTSVSNKNLTVVGNIYSNDVYTKSLFLSSTAPVIRIIDSNAVTKDAVTAFIGFYAGNGIIPAVSVGPNRAGWMGFGSTIDNHLHVKNESEGGTVLLSVSGYALGQTTCASFGMYNSLSTEFINHIPLKTGIGTSNPNEELTVSGSISASADVYDSVGKIWNVRGQAGDLVFIKDASTGEQETFKNITESQLSETSVELNEMTTSSRDFDFVSVFDEWKRFGTQPQAWALDLITPTGQPTKPSIRRTANVGYGGFISNLTYDQYLHEIRMFSTNPDDDEISIIIAYKKVGSTDCYLKVVRSPGNPGGGAATAYNWRVVAVTPSGTTTIVDRDSSVPNPINNWNFYTANDSSTGGVKIEILRDKDNITCRTTDFATSNVNSAAYLTGSAVISFNLTSNPILSIFRGSCSIGYSCESQDASYFDVQKFTNFVPGYDVTTGDKYTFDTSTKTWNKHATQTLYTDFKPGRILTDTYTRKTFYISDVSENIKIGDAGTTANRAFSTVFRNLSGQARATSFITNESVEYTGNVVTGSKTTTGTYLNVKVANGTGGWNDRYILLYS